MKKKSLKIFAIIVGVLLIGMAVFYFFNIGRTPKIDESRRQLWKSQLGNYIIEMDDKNIIIYNETQESILPFAYGKKEKNGSMLIEKLHGSVLMNAYFWKTMNYGTFSEGTLTLQNGHKRYFNKIEKLPPKKINNMTSDPIQNYDVFWNIIEENHSLIEMTNVPWKDLYSEYKSKITSKTTEKELLSIYGEMISKINDGHTVVYKSPFDGVRSKKENDSFHLYRKNQKHIEKNIESYLMGKSQSFFNNHIIVGNINIENSHVAYIRVNDFLEADLKIISKELDSLVDKIGNKDAVIIDLRLAPGGFDIFSLALVERFATKSTTVFTKQVRNGNYTQFTQPEKYTIMPNEKGIKTNKILVLTSSLTGSASEIATLGFKALDNTILIGEATNGIFSDTLLNILPNGWFISLSNELYTAYDGKNYEQKGITPNIEVKLTSEDIKNKKDRVLEEAFQVIKDNR